MSKSDFTILVVDDDPDYLFQTVFNLEKVGIKHWQLRARQRLNRLSPDVGTIFTITLPIKPITIT